LFKVNDPDADLKNLFLAFSFHDYDRPKPWPMGLPAVPYSDIVCHFGLVFIHATSNAWLGDHGTPIPLNGDCNAKFKEHYKKKTGRDDDDWSKTQYLICPDTENLPLTGMGLQC
jgi:hypothetical protein